MMTEVENTMTLTGNRALVTKQAAQNGAGFVMSECPLAGVHIQQGIERLGGDEPKPTLVTHPIQILARAYEGAA